MSISEGLNVARKVFEEAARDETKNLEDYKERIFSPDVTTLDRVLAFVGSVGSMMPDAFRDRSRKEYQAGISRANEALPIDVRNSDGKFRFHAKEVGGGYDKVVFLLESQEQGQPSLVLKFNTVRSSRDTETLIETGKKIKQQCERARDIYREMPGVVLEEYFFVGKHYWKDQKAIISFQEFLGTNLVDVLDQKNDTKLNAIFQNNPKIKEDIARFADITLKYAQENGEVVDLLGKNNLVLFQTSSGEMKLVLLEADKFFVVNHPNASFREGIDRKLQLLKSFL